MPDEVLLTCSVATADVLPSEIRHTHTIASPPHASSFEALLHSYGERIYAALPVLGEQFGGFFTSAIEGAETALEGAADWLVASSSTGAWKKTLDEMNVGEEVSMEGLVEATRLSTENSLPIARHRLHFTKV